MIYVSQAGIDAFISPDTTFGVIRSDNNGETWTPMSNGLFPSRAIWRLKTTPAAPDLIFAGMWGGSTWKLHLH